MNPITKETMTNLQNTVKRLGIIVFSKYFAALIIRATFWSSYREICPELHCDPKYGQFAKHSDRPFIYRFLLVYLCVSCKQHFGVFTLKCLLNQIMTHKMASLENIVARLRIIRSFLLLWCLPSERHFRAFTVKLWLNPIIWHKRRPICKILSHASKSSFSFSYLVLIMWATL